MQPLKHFTSQKKKKKISTGNNTILILGEVLVQKTNTPFV